MLTPILSDYGWFYIIIQAQTLTLGYGITSREDPMERLLEYARHVCAHQSFSGLYYGNMLQIRDLERYVKSQWGKYRSDLFSDKKLEWLDPEHKIDIKDLEHFAAERIVNYPYDTIRKVKKQFLPFSTTSNSGMFSNINVDPDFFLEEVKLTRKRK